jgi:hypothetical protein
MISLVKFKDLLAGNSKSGPPVSIRAGDLDGNFQALTILPDKYGIYEPEFKKDGTQLTFLAQKKEVSWREISICVNGTAKKMMVLGTDPY